MPSGAGPDRNRAFPVERQPLSARYMASSVMETGARPRSCGLPHGMTSSNTCQPPHYGNAASPGSRNHWDRTHAHEPQRNRSQSRPARHHSAYNQQVPHQQESNYPSRYHQQRRSYAERYLQHQNAQPQEHAQQQHHHLQHSDPHQTCQTEHHWPRSSHCTFWAESTRQSGCGPSRSARRPMRAGDYTADGVLNEYQHSNISIATGSDAYTLVWGL